ncbi:H/ACA ribonucleoprotein complex subunit 2 [Nematocida minor]|uniref:H/ACA ribonucleoprotein complex subunit 2 n=1 Tax=Nematocida minor TaxID=1912983 RepID=UPI002220A69C|nr:H/ACA ribonucleoprotein complex subunit 2 [Nematocida minor]KAI5191293.1 H/ACA ribonucleoprotein complex subunit 2 [Nematocida minor]
MLEVIHKQHVSPSGMSILHSKLSLSECKRGIKATQKSLLRKDAGVVILAVDVTPFDLISHIPGLCQETNTPIFYISSRFDLKTEKDKPTTCLFIPNSILSPEELSQLK